MFADDLEANQVIGGHFLLQEEIGAGGFGAVWKAVDTLGDGRAVALKILHPSFRNNSHVMDRFVREAEILQELDHPNIAKALRFGDDGKHAYIALEYIKGIPMNELLWDHSENNEPIHFDDVYRITTELFAAVEYAHEQGIVHRDLKPSNVMFIPEEGSYDVKVLDFGVAKILQTNPSESTTKGRVIGSIHYMSPEQISAGHIDSKTDIFALGTILFELLTLSRPWLRDRADRPVLFSEVQLHQNERNTKVAVMRRIAREPRPSAGAARPGLPYEVDDILSQALAIDPKERFESAADFRVAILDVLDPTEGARQLSMVGNKPGSPLTETLRKRSDSLTKIRPVDMDPDPANSPTSPHRAAVAKTVTMHPQAETQVLSESGPRTQLLLYAGVLLIGVSLLLIAAVMLSKEDPPERPVMITTKAESSKTPVEITPRPTVEVADEPARVIEEPAEDGALEEEPQKRVAEPKRKRRKPVDPTLLRIRKLKRTLAGLRKNAEHSSKDRFTLARMIDQTAEDLLEAASATSIKRCTAQTRLIPDRDRAVAALNSCISRLTKAASK